MKPARLLLVGNPTAQSGQNARRIEHAQRLLAERGLAFDFLATLPAGGTVRAVCEALCGGRYDAAAYMGGDGTFAEVAKGILGSGRAESIALGMLPTGTANDQGRSFGLAADESALPTNVDVIVAGHETRLDAGKITARDERGQTVRDDLFFDSAGWGISPRSLALRNEDRKLIDAIPVVRDVYRDQLVYAGAVLRTFLRSYVEDEKFDADVVVDGTLHRYTGLLDLVLKGTRVYGGAWVFDPTSLPDDGLFEVVPFAGRRDWVSKGLVHLDPTGVVTDSLAEIGVEHSAVQRGARIELSLRPHAGGLPLFAQIDGEQFPPTARVDVQVLPRVLRLIVPAAPTLS